MALSERTNAERQLKGFIDKFSPKQQTLIRAVRRSLRRRFPAAHELVYDNYNFFVIGYCVTERPSHCIFSIAAAANGVSLCFMYGARLSDPKKMLHGNGKQTRFLRLDSADVLDNPAAGALLKAAVADAKVPLSTKGKGNLIIRSISRKQRARRKDAKSVR